MIAELGDEIGSENFFVPLVLGKTVDSAIGRVDYRLPVGWNDIPFNPGPVVKRFPGDRVFRLASIGTSTATDTLMNIHTHRVVVLSGIILRRGGLVGQEVFRAEGRKKAEPDWKRAGHRIQKLSARHSGFLRTHFKASGA
jgi:hypothetical protein